MHLRLRPLPSLLTRLPMRLPVRLRQRPLPSPLPSQLKSLPTSRLRRPLRRQRPSRLMSLLRRPGLLAWLPLRPLMHLLRRPRPPVRLRLLRLLLHLHPALRKWQLWAAGGGIRAAMAAVTAGVMVAAMEDATEAMATTAVAMVVIGAAAIAAMTAVVTAAIGAVATAAVTAAAMPAVATAAAMPATIAAMEAAARHRRSLSSRRPLCSLLSLFIPSLRSSLLWLPLPPPYHPLGPRLPRSLCPPPSPRLPRAQCPPPSQLPLRSKVSGRRREFRSHCAAGLCFCPVLLLHLRCCCCSPTTPAPPPFPLAGPTPEAPSTPAGPVQTKISVAEGTLAYAACTDPKAVMVQIIDPIFGDATKGCNATDSYL